MKVKSKVLSIAISVLMIFSMLVCGMDQAAFAAQEVNEPVVQNETVEETGDAGKAGLNERSDATEPEEVVVNDGEPEESEVTEPEEAAANTGGTEESEETIKELKAASNNRSSGTKRTIMLYDVGSDLETEAGLASYNLRQILASRFSSDDDIKFIVMTGGSYRWQLDDDWLDDDRRAGGDWRTRNDVFVGFLREERQRCETADGEQFHDLPSSFWWLKQAVRTAFYTL